MLREIVARRKVFRQSFISDRPQLHGRGGRRHQYFSPEQEQELLAPFVERA